MRATGAYKRYCLAAQRKLRASEAQLTLENEFTVNNYHQRKCNDMKLISRIIPGNPET